MTYYVVVSVQYTGESDREGNGLGYTYFTYLLTYLLTHTYAYWFSKDFDDDDYDNDDCTAITII